MPNNRPQMVLPDVSRRSAAAPDLLDVQPRTAPTPPPAAPRYRTTQVRITETTDAVVARLDAEWRRQGNRGHVSMSAIIRAAVEALDPAGDAMLVRRLR